MAADLIRAVIFLRLIVVSCDGQSVVGNLYDSLKPLGCTRFLAILNKCGLNMRRRYQGDQTWTLIAPNDDAFSRLPPMRQNQYSNLSQTESEEYIKAFTTDLVVQTSQFYENQPKQSRQGTTLFFQRRNATRRRTGPTEYYVNGARVLRKNVPAGRSIVHVIDRVLDIPYEGTVRAFLSAQNQAGTTFYNVVINYVPPEKYSETVDTLNDEQRRFTVFVPTREALGKIPADKLARVQGNGEELTKYVQMHMIENNVTYTSFVHHNQQIKNMAKGLIAFLTSHEQEAVFVSSGGVTAQVTQGNITCKNGVVHFVDTMLGYTYYSAREQIDLEPDLQTYKDVLNSSRQDIQDAVASNLGITIFAPNEQAFRNLPKYVNYGNDTSLMNKILELGMLETGPKFQVSEANVDYESRRMLVSRFNRRPINVYSQGNEIWVEAGYVKARVVKPDLGVTNSFIHVIDAVPGVPSRDVPNTIFCESWLIKSAFHLYVTGLNDYMRDVRIQNVTPCTTNRGVQSSTNVYDAFTVDSGTSYPGPACGQACQFTIFVPNGTAFEFFENMQYGREIQSSRSRYQHVLKRHITRETIYLEEAAIGKERNFTALNGDSVQFRRTSYKHAYMHFKGKRASIIHSDIAGTNGVIHIVDQVIFMEEDVTRNTSVSNETTVTPISNETTITPISNETTTTSTSGVTRGTSISAGSLVLRVCLCWLCFCIVRLTQYT